MHLKIMNSSWSTAQVLMNNKGKKVNSVHVKMHMSFLKKRDNRKMYISKMYFEDQKNEIWNPEGDC